MKWLANEMPDCLKWSSDGIRHSIDQRPYNGWLPAQQNKLYGKQGKLTEGEEV
jgi:hypothetical protein